MRIRLEAEGDTANSGAGDCPYYAVLMKNYDAGVGKEEICAFYRILGILNCIPQENLNKKY